MKGRNRNNHNANANDGDGTETFRFEAADGTAFVSVSVNVNKLDEFNDKPSADDLIDLLTQLKELKIEPTLSKPKEYDNTVKLSMKKK